MPVQKSQSPLMAKLGAKLVEAHEKHKTEEVKLGQIELPGGIKDGIAELREFRISQIPKGKKNEGEFAFYADGIVIHPKVFNGVSIEGQRTSQYVTLVANEFKSLEDNFAKMQNFYKMFGAETKDVDLNETPTFYEDAAVAIKEMTPRPLFRFKTSELPKQTAGPNKDKPPMIYQEWQGVYDGPIEVGAPGDFVEDATAPAPAPKNGKPESTPTAAATKTPAKTPPTKGKPAPAKAPEPPPPPVDEGPVDLDALLAEIEGGNEDAIFKLNEIALAAGIEKDVIESDDTTWAQVVEMVKELEAGDTVVTDGAEEVWAKVGDIYGFKPLNKATKKPVAKAIECEITSVDAAKETVDLLNATDRKTVYKGIGWDKLESLA